MIKRWQTLIKYVTNILIRQWHARVFSWSGLIMGDVLCRPNYCMSDLGTQYARVKNSSPSRQNHPDRYDLLGRRDKYHRYYQHIKQRPCRGQAQQQQQQHNNNKNSRQTWTALVNSVNNGIVTSHRSSVSVHVCWLECSSNSCSTIWFTNSMA